MKKLFLLLFFFSLLQAIEAQTKVRYLDEIYTDTTRKTLQYGQNWSIITLQSLGKTSKLPLPMEMVEAKGDTGTKRPAVIYLHTGNFLPRITGLTGPSGQRDDSTALEICGRLAKMGYVAFSADYRLGWDPSNNDPNLGQIIRTATLINAAYRGVQDIRTCIRYIKANATALKVDTSRIIVWGQGTGGYLSLGLATLDNQAEIEVTKFGPQKYFIPGATPTPMVHPTVNGDLESVGNTAAPQSLVTFGFKLGDSLNSTQLGTYGPSSNFQLCVNMGGAVGDLGWMDTTSITGSLGATGRRPLPVPIISFHVPYDPFAPYDDDILNVPRPGTTPLPVVRVQGSFRVALKSDSLGTNNAFRTVVARDPYGAIQKTRSSTTGLFPIYGTAGNAFDSSPWDFWDKTLNPNNTSGLQTNPDMSAAKAKRYIDTMVGFVAPRACIALNLPCRFIVTSTEEILNAYATKLLISPNPAQTVVSFQSETFNPIQAIELFDLSGRSVKAVKNINNSQYQFERGNLPTGMYIAKVKFEGGILSKKVVFENK
jgi:Secretion system C-terminal sorting domain/Dienelactone hydrolase family